MLSAAGGELAGRRRVVKEVGKRLYTPTHERIVERVLGGTHQDAVSVPGSGAKSGMYTRVL